MHGHLRLLPAILFLLYWFLAFGALLLYLHKKCWPKSNPKIHFFITDLWAAIIGLTPTFLVVRFYGLMPARIYSINIFMIGILLLSQLCGLAGGWIVHADQAANSSFGRLHRALWLVLAEGILAPALLAVVAGTFGLAADPAFGTLRRIVDLFILLPLSFFHA